MSVALLDNELVLLQKVAKGDESAFEAVFNHYKPFILRSAFRLTANHELAEDILQETFLKVWLKRDILPEVQNFTGWLYTIFEHYMLNAVKKINHVGRQNKQMEKELASQINLPHISVETKEIQKIIEEAVKRLPEKQRMTFKLIREEGLSRQEAATILQVGAETVKTNLDLAIKFVRAYCLKKLDKYPLAPYLFIFFKLFF